MSSPEQLKFIAHKLAAAPFNKQGITAISLHDDLAIPVLVSYLSDVAGVIDNQQKVDYTKESFEEMSERLAYFLNMLNYAQAADVQEYMIALSKSKKQIHEAMYFLLNDIETHKKRAYLAPFLEAVGVPPEFMHDQSILELQGQLGELQEQFKATHKYVQGLKQPGVSASSMKREIQQMEEEKQQLLSKISKLQQKVVQVPNHETWLEASKSLRIEQQKQMEITERTKEQRALIQQCDAKILKLRQSLKETQSAIGDKSSDVVLAKMEQEHKMNKYLATENLPKQIKDAQMKVHDFSNVLHEPALSDSDLRSLETEIKLMNEEVARLAEKRMEKTRSSGTDKMALFRQQASIIARKKEGTAQRYRTLQDEVKHLTAECAHKRESKGGGIKILKGEDFKKYVADLRLKSAIYKKKKSEISEVVAEFGILQRTEEILKQREKSMSESIAEMEKKKGVLGFHAAQETLEKVSEKKSELDEKKGKTLTEISEIVQTLMQTINEKKEKLAPIIQELRALRQSVQDLELEHADKKKAYDATMAGLDSEAVSLDQEVKALRNQIQNLHSRLHYLNTMIGYKEILNERVIQEMKAYIGGDDVIEAQQRARGFKTYRDMYNKKIQELDHAGKNLRESQKEIKASHEPNIRQLEMFNDLKKLLTLKIEHNKMLLKHGGRVGDYEGSRVMKDRLIL